MSHHLHRHLAARRAGRSTTVIDWLMMVTAFAFPLVGLPQAVQIFHSHDASGVSLLSWVAFLAFDAIEMFYGMAHSIKPLIITGILWLIVDGLVVLGILMYH